MREFDAFTTTTAIMASYFSFASTVSGWMTRNGVAPENARSYVAEMLRGLAATSLAMPHRSFTALAEEGLAAPRGADPQLRFGRREVLLWADGWIVAGS